MRMLRFIACLIIAAVTPEYVAGQASVTMEWPRHPLTFIMPAPPGGAVDLAARVIGERISPRLGQPVIVESRPGADGIVAAEAFLSAKDASHSFLVSFGGLLINNPVTYEKLPYDVERDFVPVAMIALDTIAVCTNRSIQADDVAGLLRIMRERPEAVRWASAPGEPRLRFAGTLKKARATALYVPYKATSQAVTDLIAGRIDVMVVPLASVMPHVRAGTLKLLVIMAERRAPIVPDVATAGEAGFPQLAMLPFIGVFARAGTPNAIVDRMNREISAALDEPDVRQRLTGAGLVPAPRTPRELGAIVRSKLEENRDLARAVGPLRE